MDIGGAADLLPDSQQAAVRRSVPLFICRHVAGLGHRERHSRVHGACETARSKELADSKATAPLREACGTSAGEGVAPCFGGDPCDAALRRHVLRFEVSGEVLVGQASVDAHAGVHAAHLPRATQTIPPAVRRHVLRRDHGRCVVPGCRHATYVDLHHLVARAEGGQHDPDLLVTLCGAHHRALHRGALIIEARLPGA